jgi:glycosyltransferase involved in cell wall biosynthesis
MASSITVLMPTLNAEDYLREALDSLSAQTLQDFKVLVLDGGSTDDTRRVALSYDRVEFIDCGRVGLGAQLRVGLDRVTTPFVARMDADDVSLPGRFERQAQTLEQSDFAIVGGQIDLLVGSKVCRGQPLPRAHSGIRRLLLTGFPAFCNSAVMFRTDVARRCRAYSVKGLGEDLDFFLRMTEAGRGHNLPDPILRVRIHEQSTCFTSFEEVRRNYAYALHCAEARRNGARAPSEGEYATEWSRRGGVARLLTRLECFAVRLYRKSRGRLAAGDRIRGMLGVILSLLVRPRLIQARTLIKLADLVPGRDAV